MSTAPIWIFTSSVAASAVLLAGIFVHTFLASVDEITQPCQHLGVWNGSACDCSLAGGVWGGAYCEVSACANRGRPVLDDAWACRCGSTRSDAGRLCSACYTEDCGAREPSCNVSAYADAAKVGLGVPVGDLEGAKVAGRRCNQICLPRASSVACNGVDAGRDGSCVACNGHGTCESGTACLCDPGWYDAPGAPCSVTCEDACGPNAVCRIRAGKPECACRPGFFNEPACNVSCPGVDPDTREGIPCFGHGTCSSAAFQQLGLPHFHPTDTPARDFAVCACEPTFAAEGSFACAHECPHRATVPLPCSGHGTCSMDPDLEGVTCACEEGWSGPRCDCHPAYTCSGHGTCSAEGTCICDAGDPVASSTNEPTVGHFSGARCGSCADGWYPEGKCTRYCDPNARYDGSAHVFPTATHDGFGCWGHGACTWDGTSVGCKCRGNTDPDVYCAECTAPYYPKHRWVSGIPDEAYCVTRCDSDTCSGNGACDPLYAPGGHLCLCEVNSRGMDTLDAARNCGACQPGWYPYGAEDTRCDRFCSASLELTADSGCDHMVKRVSDLYGPLRTLETPDVLGVPRTRVGRGPRLNRSLTVPCLNCNPQASCSADGACVCPEGVTGLQCDKACDSFRSDTCAGHGTCQQSALVQWFDPESDVVECACDPLDEYTAEVRAYYARIGVTLDAPPTPTYFGRACEYHCPTYNRKICAERGTCKPTPVAPLTRCTRKNPTCPEESGVFCADVPTPWDDYAITTLDVASYFQGSAPGATLCRAASCVDDLEEQNYQQICVGLLNGLYPADLNGAACSSFESSACNQALIDAFTRGHTSPPFRVEGRTLHAEDAWGERVAVALVWHGDQVSAHDVSADMTLDLDTCRNLSLTRVDTGNGLGYWTRGDDRATTCHLPAVDRVDLFHDNTWCEQSEVIFNEANVSSACAEASFAASMAETACLSHDIRSSCILDSACLFDASPTYMRALTDRCLPLDADACAADPYCLFSGNSMTCDPRTFCRARTCGDTLNDVGIAPMCTELGTCAVEDPDTACVELTQRAVNKSAQLHADVGSAEPPLAAEELFFYCWNWFDKDYPLRYQLPPPGDVTLAHADDYTRAAIAVLRARDQNPAAVRDGSFQTARDVAVSADWCVHHLATRWPVNDTRSYVAPPVAVVCDALVAFETDASVAAALAVWYAGALNESCVVRYTDEPESLEPGGGLDGWRWSHGAPGAWDAFCDAFADCDEATVFDLRAPAMRETPLDVHTVWTGPDEIGLFKGAARTSERDGWHAALPLVQSAPDPPTIDGNVIRSTGVTPLHVTLAWPLLNRTDTYTVLPGTTPITPLTLAAVLTNDTYEWNATGPFQASLAADGTLTIAPGVLERADGTLGYARLFYNGTVAPGTSSTVAATALRPTITATTTFTTWSTTVHVVAGEPTFAFELVGDQGHSALRLECVRGALYVRGGDRIGTVTDHLDVLWDAAGLHVNGAHVPTALQHLPRTVHVYSTRADADLRVRIVHEGELLTGPLTHRFEAPTRAVYDTRGLVELPATVGNISRIRATLAGELLLPGIGALRASAATAVEVELEAAPVVVPVRLEVADRNGGFQDPTATHAGVYTPVWSLEQVYTTGDMVLYDGYTYEALQATTAAPVAGANWTLRSDQPRWMHGGRLRIVPPLAVPSLAGGTYVADTLEEATYAGDFVLGQVYEVNATGWSVTATARAEGAPVWTRNATRPHRSPPRVEVLGTVEDLQLRAGPAHCAEAYAVTDIAYEVCADQPCTWPPSDPLELCARTRAYDDAPGLEGLGLDWGAFCAYAHPTDYDWSGVHFGYEWHHHCDASDIVCDETWTQQCFRRTEPYAETCARGCIDTLRNRVDGAICDRVNRLSNVTRLVGGACDGEACSIDFTPRSFCETQQAQHDITVRGLNVTHRVLLPFLDATSCSATCSSHLRSVLTWDAWEATCAALGAGARPGYCSRSSCDCETGYDGQQCELECPVGSADGADATCSGANGFCVPLSTELLVVDTGRQQERGEYVAGDPHLTNQPLWMGGPETITGVCQCTTGSGSDCSLRCENSNNGTYGPELRSQYGICDSNLATVKALPPCTRYNAEFITETGVPVAYNSTTYDQAQLVYPERLFYCNLTYLYRGAVDAVVNRSAPPAALVTPAPREAWRVLTEICWPWGNSTARSETRRKASQDPEYDPAAWYWDLETTLNLTAAWEADTGQAFPTSRVPASLAAADRSFNVSGTIVGVARGALGARSVAWAAYGKHVVVRGTQPMNRARACWAQYGSIVLMYGGRIFTNTGGDCAEDNIDACGGQDSVELWRFDADAAGLVTLDAHAVAIDGPGTALERPFAADEGVAYLWTDQLWRLDLTGAWAWSVVNHVADTSVAPGPVARLVLGSLITSTCTLDVTAAVLECVAPGEPQAVEWDPPAPQETPCMLELADNKVYVDAERLVEFDEAPRVRVFLHDLKTMDAQADTFSLRVRNAVQVPIDC